jgi:hypothetical protein
MIRRNDLEPDYGSEVYEVSVAGHSRALFFRPGPSWCGGITDGVCLRFDGEGGWVIDLAELEEMCRIARETRAAAKSMPVKP